MSFLPGISGSVAKSVMLFLVLTYTCILDQGNHRSYAWICAHSSHWNPIGVRLTVAIEWDNGLQMYQHVSVEWNVIKHF